MDTSEGLFEIQTVDVRGVPTKVFVNAPPSLRAIWDMSAAFADNVYLVYEDERITFADAHRMVRSVARWLTEQGVQLGDRVAIATRNYPEYAIAFWATQAIGAVAVPLNAWWTGPSSRTDWPTRAAWCCSPTASGPSASRRTSTRPTSAPPCWFVPTSTSRTRSRGPTSPNGDDPPLPEVAIDVDADATIMYTSGTTGRPKGAVQTNRNFGNFLMQGVYLTTAAAEHAPPPDPDAPAPLPLATLLTFPLFHVGGLQSFLLPYTAAGGKIVLMYKWDPELAVDLIEREQVTTVAGVPTTVFQLLEVAEQKGIELESLSGISSGATLVPPELVRRIDEQTHSRAAPGNGYGLTETSGAAIANFGKAYVDNPESVGKPISPVIEAAHRRCRRRSGADRRGRRDLVEGADGRARLLRSRRGDRERVHRRLVPHRRPRPRSTTTATSTSSTA